MTTATPDTSPPVPQPWAAVSCVTAACSRCGGSPGHDDDDSAGIPHFTSAEQARRQLLEYYEWRIEAGSGGEQLLCRTCAARDDCARLGHVPWTSAGALMADGRVLGKSAWCDRCCELLSREPGTPAPPGYPVPEPARQDLYWDAAALPAGRDLAAAAARLLARMSDAAVAARWDAWDGDQAGRPGPAAAPDPASDPASDKAAALTLIQAAHKLLLCAAAGHAAAPVPGGDLPR